MGYLLSIPEEYRNAEAERVKQALISRVSIEDVRSFEFPKDQLANSKLREGAASMLSANDELWWFSTPFQGLSGMAGYACVRDDKVVDYIVVVQS